MTDSRFISFIRRTLAFKGKTLLLTVGVIFGAMAMLVALNTETDRARYTQPQHAIEASASNASSDVAPLFPDPNWGSEINLTLLFLFVTAAIAGAWFYGDFASKQKRLEALTLPVSSASRFWSSFIIYTVGTWAAVFACTFIIDACRVFILRSVYDLGELARFLPFKTLITLNTRPPVDADDISFCFLFFGLVLLVQALFTAGSIYLPKNALAKTAGLLWAANAAFGILGWLGYRAFFAGVAGVEMRPSLTQGWNGPILIGASLLTLTVIFYALSYWRMRETEVADRW